MEPTAYDSFQEGCRLLANESPHAAVVALERARDLEPDKGSIRETLGRAYFRTGRFGEARAEFSRAVDIEPIMGAAAAISALRDAGFRVAFVSNNSSQPVGEVAAKLATTGVRASSDDV